MTFWKLNSQCQIARLYWYSCSAKHDAALSGGESKSLITVDSRSTLARQNSTWGPIRRNCAQFKNKFGNIVKESCLAVCSVAIGSKPE